MAYYYKVNDSTEDKFPPHVGFHLQTVKKHKVSGPKINYDFSKHVLIELLDDTTPETKLWIELGLTNDKNIIHKRMMIDPHRIKCRRAVVICINSDAATTLSNRISQTKVMNRCICAVVIQDLLTDLCLFEKQIFQYGDNRPQQQLLYVSDLSRSRGTSGLVKFLKDKFSPFGTISSILVCADDDDYAFPEGVIKFSYLSEALAAELAFDQFVVGKERLSVTTHHNILLSQCDLRVRLRDAQLCYNTECNVSSSSLFQSNKTYELNDLDNVNNASVVNSLSNLYISHINDALTIGNNSKLDKSENCIPAFSQSNFVMNISRNDCGKFSTYQVVKKNNVPDDFSVCANSVLNKKVINDMTDNINPEMAIYNSETIPFELTTTKIINQENQSHIYNFSSPKDIHHKTSPSIYKSCKSTSDAASFVTCNNTNLVSVKKTILNRLPFHVSNTVSEYQTVSSQNLQLSSLCNDILNDSVVGKSRTKNSIKRKKKFTPSKKLSLKSQRIDSSQNCTLNACTKSQVSASEQSLLKSNNPKCRRNLDLSNTENHQNTESFELSGSSKVVDWLLKLPAANSESTYLSCEKENINVENMFCEENNLSRNIISEQNIPISEDAFSCLNNSLENGNHSKYPIFSSDALSLRDKSKSPLQMWLKQELISSTNNNVIKSQDTSKSMIVCATKTKDVIISVGCSHMTCDSCYPQSTDLLLGYN